MKPFLKRVVDECVSAHPCLRYITAPMIITAATTIRATGRSPIADHVELLMVAMVALAVSSEPTIEGNIFDRIIAPTPIVTAQIMITIVPLVISILPPPQILY